MKKRILGNTGQIFERGGRTSKPQQRDDRRQASQKKRGIFLRGWDI
jgi:hypothetical protein